jgi:uncharacterized protein with HEPN domain
VNRDEPYLHHVLDAIGKIERYVQVGHEAFMADSHWQDAVIRQLEIIGEAVKKISPETLGRRPEIPWRRIVGMRDILAHDYMGINIDAVWQVAQQELGQLREAVEDLLGMAQ